MSVRFWLRAHSDPLSASLFRNPHEFDDLFLVETDDHIVTYHDDRYAHLRGDVEHLLALLDVLGNVVIGVLDAVLAKELLGHLAEMACWGRVDIDGLCCVRIELESY